MQQRIKDLAEQAGFALWEDEEWKPHGEVIDWSSRYDDELEKLVHLVVQECCEVAHCNFHVGGFELIELIKKHFEGE